MDFTLFIVRNVVSQPSENERGLEAAQRRLHSAFSNDQREARKLVWHAAQIVAVANEYLVSAPCEILRLFMGYVYIIAFAKYFPRSFEYHGPHASRIRLDVHQADNQTVKQWIEQGGPACIGSVNDICADGAALLISQDAQSILGRLRCWGLADKFIKILQSFAKHGG
jgi:hypothetical protein